MMLPILIIERIYKAYIEGVSVEDIAKEVNIRKKVILKLIEKGIPEQGIEALKKRAKKAYKSYSKLTDEEEANKLINRIDKIDTLLNLASENIKERIELGTKLLKEIAENYENWKEVPINKQKMIKQFAYFVNIEDIQMIFSEREDIFRNIYKIKYPQKDQPGFVHININTQDPFKTTSNSNIELPLLTGRRLLEEQLPEIRKLDMTDKEMANITNTLYDEGVKRR